MSLESSGDYKNSIDRQEISRRCETIIQYSRFNYPRFDLDYFRGKGSYFGPDIDQDIHYLDKIKLGFRERESHLPIRDREKIGSSKKRSEALEIIIADQIETNNWFGDDALFFRTTEYDDYTNGVDAVVEFTSLEDDMFIALAIDSTSKTDVATLAPKINRNITRMLTDKAMVKYYQSPRLDSPYIGPIYNIIPVVIGLEGRNTSNLVITFSRLINLNKTSSDVTLPNNIRAVARSQFNQLRKIIEQDPVQIIFLEEIRDQLIMYQSIFKESKQRSRLTDKQIHSFIQLLDSILDDKKDLSVALNFEIPNGDAVFNTIRSITQNKK